MERQVIDYITLYVQIQKDRALLELDFPTSLISDITRLCLDADGVSTWHAVRATLLVQGLDHADPRP